MQPTPERRIEIIPPGGRPREEAADEPRMPWPGHSAPADNALTRAIRYLSVGATVALGLGLTVAFGAVALAALAILLPVGAAAALWGWWKFRKSLPRGGGQARMIWIRHGATFASAARAFEEARRGQGPKRDGGGP